MKRPSCILLVLLLAVLGGCASQQQAANPYDRDSIARALDDDDAYFDEAQATQLVPDPLEGWNRAMFTINDGFITYVGRPVSNAWVSITAPPVRSGISNFFTNLLFPVRFANNLLQGKGYEAGQEFGKFLLNTTAGLGGFVDYTGLNHPELAHLDAEDFGQTLGVWGMGEGIYLYWPLLGPSSARDTVGLVGDWAADPISWVQPWWTPWAIKGVKNINELDGILDTYETMTKSSLEPYIAVRDAYTQYRRAKIAK